MKQTWMNHPELDAVREFAAELNNEGKTWKGDTFGWQAEYHPERPEPPLDSKMTFTPADFCIGESGIWFFSLMWEHGKTCLLQNFWMTKTSWQEQIGERQQTRVESDKFYGRSTPERGIVVEGATLHYSE
jgi:hypothetical protein